MNPAAPHLDACQAQVSEQLDGEAVRVDGEALRGGHAHCGQQLLL